MNKTIKEQIKLITTRIDRTSLVILILFMSFYLFSSIYSLGMREFSEGEDEIINVMHAIKLSNFTSSPEQLMRPFVINRLPFAYLFITPVPLFFPSNELTLRLPGIIFGALIIPLLFITTKNMFGRKTALISVAFYVCSGIFSINRLTLGIGTCIFFILFSFYFFSKSLKVLETKESSRLLSYSALSLLIAGLTFQDSVMFSFPILFLVIYSHIRQNIALRVIIRRVFIFGGLYYGGLLLYYILGFGVYAIYQNMQNNPIQPANFEPIVHWVRRLEGAATTNNNLETYFDAYTSYNSMPFVVLLCIGLIFSFVKNKKQVLTILFFIAPHALAWLIIIDGPLLEHPLFILPLLCALAASGIVCLFDFLSKHNKSIAYLYGATIVIALFGSYILNFAYFDGLFGVIIPNNARSLTGHGDIDHIGYKTAGYVIRKNSSEEAVWLAPGTSGAMTYYANRQVGRISDNEQDYPEYSGVVILPNDSPLNNDFESIALEKSTITNKGDVLLNLYFLSPPKNSLAITYDTESYDPKYDALFSDW